MSGNSLDGERRIVLWVPDWPIASLAASVPPLAPAATIRAGVVVATTRTARVYGVRLGMRQSTAQHLCEELLVLPHDPVRDDSAFEGLLTVFDQVIAGVCALWPGMAWAPLPEGSRWRATEEELVAVLAEQIVSDSGIEAYVGIGTGMATATAAARRGICVEPQETLPFLASLSVRELLDFLPEEERQDYEGTLHLLDMLGIRTVRQFHELGSKQVLSRCGRIGQQLWTLGQGGDLYVPHQVAPLPEVQVRLDFDPVVTQTDHAVVGARRVSQELVDRLERKGLFAHAVVISLETEDAVVSQRRWTLFNTSSSAQIAQRVIWQIRSWQERAVTETGGPETVGPGAALHSIAITAGDLLSSFTTGTLWGGAEANDRVNQAVAQVQLLLGEDAVRQPVIQGGLDPRARVVRQNWGQSAVLAPRAGEWAGGIKEPPPILYAVPPSVTLFGQDSRDTWGPIGVDHRGNLTGNPQRMLVTQGRVELPAGSYQVKDFTGLWAVKGQWWSSEPAQRISRCFLRLTTEDGADLLLVQQGQQWHIEGIYASHYQSAPL